MTVKLTFLIVFTAASLIRKTLNYSITVSLTYCSKRPPDSYGTKFIGPTLKSQASRLRSKVYFRRKFIIA